MKKGFKFVIENILPTVTSIGQILAAVLAYWQPVSSTVRNSGWIILWISGIFGMLPIFTFRKWGGVQKGSSYVKTNVLVDKGIYSIVRHPQYLAGILISIGLVLIAPGRLNIALGAINMVQYCAGSIDEEKSLIDQFGNAYVAYKKRVPRFNVILGVFRRIKDLFFNSKF